uniref:Uncharacterized protein n=1 Tax=Bracon brevicornis TaxID=1563983 RepID=A0A6V7LM76_9HYME
MSIKLGDLFWPQPDPCLNSDDGLNHHHHWLNVDNSLWTRLTMQSGHKLNRQPETNCHQHAWANVTFQGFIFLGPCSVAKPGPRFSTFGPQWGQASFYCDFLPGI